MSLQQKFMKNLRGSNCIKRIIDSCRKSIIGAYNCMPSLTGFDFLRVQLMGQLANITFQSKECQNMFG